MELKPWELEQLQPPEFLQLWDGYRWRQEQQENISAYFVCQLMNISGKSLKRSIAPKDLLKPLRPTKKEKTRKEDEEYLRRLHNLGGGGR